jgi:hypothetical protein
MREVSSQADAFRQRPKAREGGRESLGGHVAAHCADPDAVICAHC